VSLEGVPDQRLRDSIAVSLARFRSGEILLGELVDRLDSAWNEVAPSKWRDDFRGHWWTLEQVYAVAIDRGELDALPPDAASDITEAIEGIESLLEAAK
jgi:hypothetical protein